MTQGQAAAALPIGGRAAAAMRLHAALDARRRELGLAWWQVAVQTGLTENVFRRMAAGDASDRTRDLAQDWLDRHTAPSHSQTP